MQSNVRCVAAGLSAAVQEIAVKEAEDLLAAGQHAAAVAQLQRAIDLGHLPSRARLADLFLSDREGFSDQTIITTIFPRIYARTYYAHPHARVMTFSEGRPSQAACSTSPQRSFLKDCRKIPA
jgi:hypothetical protein